MKKKKNKPYMTSQVKTTANRYITLYPNFKGYKRNGYGPIDTEKWLYNNLMPTFYKKFGLTETLLINLINIGTK